ncbi:MAG: SAM-dependent chlorinase/fluorinase [Pyrinomonadaceae bacterium]
MPRALITLLTDFGTADYFVGAMKGVILSINPKAQIVDLTHEIPPQDVPAAAFTLLAAYKEFPSQTIHVAVVDPGVGSARRPILTSCAGQFFVGPDNGLLSYVLEREGQASVIHIQNEQYFRQPLSATFHGRDVFAPVAAALGTGIEPAEFGEEITDYARLESLAPSCLAKGAMRARIIHIDRFGNCVTNLTRAHVTDEAIARGVRLIIKGEEITSFRHFFADESDGSDELFAIWGSAGFLEIVARNASAAQALKAKPGELVQCVLPGSPIRRTIKRSTKSY